MESEICPGLKAMTKIPKIAKIRRIREKRCQGSSWRAVDETANFTKITNFTRIAKIRRIRKIRNFRKFQFGLMDERTRYISV